MDRKVIIAGNWKMNKTAAEGKALVEALKGLVADVCPSKADIVVCPPFTTIAAVAEAIKGSNIKLGAQNIHWAANGAFTGEIAADMLKELGVEYVIIGHSERRQYFGETDETVNKRVKAALAAGFKPIVCIGEMLEERESGKTATPELAEETHNFIRMTLNDMFGKEVGEGVRIQYGGSMNPKNAAELLAQPDIDGGLIGGAALKPADFVEIINAANQD